uniref:Nudix hydrolase domain-containing protein n=1 Tax=Thermosporothrix sp. COM3 TaxID=2490863 RepID=A0A455SQK0_9CHLR|nr:hypothetical protein KTC_44490 [Thermosporothrix sp. COM3]
MAEQSQEKKVLAGVAVLVKNGGRVLLNKRHNVHGAGTWGPIAGHQEFGESFEDCAKRETKEEAGITIDDVAFRVITNDVFEAEQKHYVTVWFDANYVSGELKVGAPEEESDIGWFSWDSLPEPLFLPLQHLLNGETYPSQTTRQKLGEAIEIDTKPSNRETSPTKTD